MAWFDQVACPGSRKAAKGVLGGGTAVAGGTGRVKLLTWGTSYFCTESSYFQPESAPNPFLLLQDLIFRIFVPEI